jgi:anti-sigma factor RsiW
MPLTDEDRAALSAYLDGELDEKATQVIEARLIAENDLRSEYELLRQTWNLLDYLPRVPASPNFTSRTLERLTIQKQAAEKSWAGWLARRVRVETAVWAAVILLALGMGYLIGDYLTAGTDPDPNEVLVRHLRIIENWPVYQHTDDLKFLKRLDQAQLFDDDSGS